MARDMSTGMTRSDVRSLQLALNYHLRGQGGPDLAVDGAFGSKTKAAVVKAQTIANLIQDGIVGRKTTMALLQGQF